MNTLSITTTKTMTYDAAEAVQAFAIVEKLVRVTGALLQVARRMASPSATPALQGAYAHP